MRAVSILAVLIAIFAVGCGGEKVVDWKKIVERDGLIYEVNSEEPFTGRVVSYHSNGKKESEAEYHNGKWHGKGITWYEDGHMEIYCKYHDGKRISAKGWGEDGFPNLPGEKISAKSWDGFPILCK